MTGLNTRWLLRGLLLCMTVPGMAGSSSGAEPAASPLIPIELTQVDDKAIAYATFQSHNQKVVSNRYGIFITYVRSAAENYMAQNWLLAHSSNGGRTFKALFEETRATSAPVLETDRRGELYLTRPDFADGNAYLSRFATPTAKPVTTTLVGGSAGSTVNFWTKPVNVSISSPIMERSMSPEPTGPCGRRSACLWRDPRRLLSIRT